MILIKRIGQKPTAQEDASISVTAVLIFNFTINFNLFFLFQSLFTRLNALVMVYSDKG